MLILIIIAFIVLHLLRVITTLGELVILLNPNKDNRVIQSGAGVPLWLEITCSVSELLMVINSSLNVIIYLYANSTELSATFSVVIPKYCKCCLNQRSPDTRNITRNTIILRKPQASSQVNSNSQVIPRITLNSEAATVAIDQHLLAPPGISNQQITLSNIEPELRRHSSISNEAFSLHRYRYKVPDTSYRRRSSTRKPNAATIELKRRNSVYHV